MASRKKYEDKDCEIRVADSNNSPESGTYTSRLPYETSPEPHQLCFPFPPLSDEYGDIRLRLNIYKESKVVDVNLRPASPVLDRPNLVPMLIDSGMEAANVADEPPLIRPKFPQEEPRLTMSPSEINAVSRRQTKETDALKKATAPTRGNKPAKPAQSHSDNKEAWTLAIIFGVMGIGLLVNTLSLGPIGIVLIFLLAVILSAAYFGTK